MESHIALYKVDFTQSRQIIRQVQTWNHQVQRFSLLGLGHGEHDVCQLCGKLFHVFVSKHN